MIGIIDYGMGNIHSVKNAISKLGFEYVLSNDLDVLASCDKLILPGVGAFGDAMDNINKLGLYEPIKKMVLEDKKPILGICLGMQALFESSEEKGSSQGFGFLKGKIVLMEEPGLRIPHMGWNELEKNQESPIFDRISSNPFVYFVHSYYAQSYEDADLIGYATYGSLKVPGVVRHENVLGCQFHPEKSGEDGLAILKYYLEEFK